MEIGTIIGDKAYSVQYIADTPRYADYLSTIQKMIDSLVIKKSLGTGIGPMLYNSTNLYLENVEKCYNGLCYIQWSRHLTAGLTVRYTLINRSPVDQLILEHGSITITHGKVKE